MGLFSLESYLTGEPCDYFLLFLDFSLTQAFKWALLFLFFLLFPTFLICSYFSLLFHENALLSLLFHSKMTFTRKNPQLFPRSLPLLRFYKSTSKFIQGARRLTPQLLMFYLKVSLFWLVLLSQVLSCSFNLKLLISNSSL